MTAKFESKPPPSFEIADLGFQESDPRYPDAVKCVQTYWKQATRLTNKQCARYLGFLNARSTEDYLSKPSSHAWATSHILYWRSHDSLGEFLAECIYWPDYLLLSSLYQHLPKDYIAAVKARFGDSIIYDHTNEYRLFYPEPTTSCQKNADESITTSRPPNPILTNNKRASNKQKNAALTIKKENVVPALAAGGSRHQIAAPTQKKSDEAPASSSQQKNATSARTQLYSASPTTARTLITSLVPSSSSFKGILQEPVEALVDLVDADGRVIGPINKTELWNQWVKAILCLPIKRPVKIRRGRIFTTDHLAGIYEHTDSKGLKWLSCMIQAIGEIQAQRCFYCDKNKGAFDDCIIIGGPLFPKCGNCEWNHQGCHGAARGVAQETLNIDNVVGILSLPNKKRLGSATESSPKRARLDGNEILEKVNQQGEIFRQAMNELQCNQDIKLREVSEAVERNTRALSGMQRELRQFMSAVSTTLRNIQERLDE